MSSVLHSVAFEGILQKQENTFRLNVTFRRFLFDLERAAQAIEATEMPHEYAEILRIGLKQF